MPAASSPAEPSPVRQVGAVWVGIGGCSSLDPPYGKTNLELSFPGDANLHFTSTSEVTLFGALPNRHPRDSKHELLGCFQELLVHTSAAPGKEAKWKLPAFFVCSEQSSK